MKALLISTIIFIAPFSQRIAAGERCFSRFYFSLVYGVSFYYITYL
jgi:hypothetical protein